jgi:LDH2 family malate/lactate/ureidoglycolate dehydrogenase
LEKGGSMVEFVDFPSDPAQETVVPIDPLKSWIARIFERIGMYGFEADVVAARMIDADLRGDLAHGCRMTKSLLDAMDTGDIDPRAEMVTVSETPAMAVVDAGDGMGQVAATRGMQKAIQKAKDVGTGTVVIKRSRHFGAAAAYVQLAIDAGLIGFCTTSPAGATVAAYGSQQPATADNAFAWGIPTRAGAPFVLDTACAAASWSKIRSLALYGQPLPLGWAIDADGRETQDPRSAATLLPCNSPCSFGLALLYSALAGPLVGGRMPIHKKQSLLRGPSEHFFYAIDVSKFVEPDKFYDRLESAMEEIRNLPPAVGFDRVRLPGEREWERAQHCRQAGLPLHRDTLAELTDLGRTRNTPVPW